MLKQGQVQRLLPIAGYEQVPKQRAWQVFSQELAYEYASGQRKK